MPFHPWTRFVQVLALTGALAFGGCDAANGGSIRVRVAVDRSNGASGVHPESVEGRWFEDVETVISLDSRSRDSVAGLAWSRADTMNSSAWSSSRLDPKGDWVMDFEWFSTQVRGTGTYPKSLDGLWLRMRWPDGVREYLVRDSGGVRDVVRLEESGRGMKRGAKVGTITSGPEGAMKPDAGRTGDWAVRIED